MPETILSSANRSAPARRPGLAYLVFYYSDESRKLGAGPSQGPATKQPVRFARPLTNGAALLRIPSRAQRAPRQGGVQAGASR
jgi:hypothetical protein